MNSVQVRWLLVMLAFAAGLLIAGLIMPVMTITSLVFFHDSFSILSGVYQLLLNGHVVLFVVIGLFSIVIPWLKILLLFRVISSRHAASQDVKKLLHLMHAYGRWSMLDVMVVALLLVTVKLGALASVQVHTGFYLFGGAVLMLMFITQKVVQLTEDQS